MTHDVTEDAPPQGSDVGPDPVVGAGIALLGIFVMGVAGAADAHYPFDVGVLTAVAGAGIFVGSVALSVVKQRALAAAEEEAADDDDSAEASS